MDNEARLHALGLSVSELANHMSVTRQYILDWLSGTLHGEELDVIEVGVSLLEMHLSMCRRSSDEPTQRISLVA